MFISRWSIFLNFWIQLQQQNYANIFFIIKQINTCYQCPGRVPYLHIKPSMWLQCEHAGFPQSPFDQQVKGAPQDDVDSPLFTHEENALQYGHLGFLQSSLNQQVKGTWQDDVDRLCVLDPLWRSTSKYLAFKPNISKEKRYSNQHTTTRMPLPKYYFAPEK